jgi:6-phosphogluconolactonase
MMRRHYLVDILLILFVSCWAVGVSQNNARIPLFIGTYTGEGSNGIYRSWFDTQSGKLSTPQLEASLLNPSYLAISANNHYLWSVGEMDTTYCLTAFSIENQDSLKYINHQSGRGSYSCHISELQPMKWLGAASYGSGLVMLYPLNMNGAIGTLATVDQHWGKVPHAHCILADPKADFIYSADLGIDKVLIYKILNNRLCPWGEIDLPKGVGPRHIDFSPNGEWMAVVNELKSRIIILARDTTGAFGIIIHNISTLPSIFKGPNAAAGIHFSVDGRFLYASNRGDNSIVVCSFDQKSGDVKPIQWVKDDINWPRNFTLDPTGKFVIVANQYGNSIVVFRRNLNTGLLTSIHEVVRLSHPVCLKFLHYNN